MVAFQFLRAEHEIQLRADAVSIEGVAERSGRQTPGELKTAEAKEFHSGCDVAKGGLSAIKEKVGKKERPMPACGTKCGSDA